uniref:Putative methyltransferase n=1 Tax=viral metagenome TaxID=1070528 RepID=A0A6M3IYU3_9ZZZZ
MRGADGVNPHFSSERHDWRTPKALYARLDAEFHFDFDPCPVDPDFDGLAVEWGERNFVNPPYGREIGKWCAKALEEARKGKLVVMLIPARTDTRWWHEYIMKADEIRLIKGRLRFDDGTVGAPFPSVVVVLKGPRLSMWPMLRSIEAG